MEGEMYTPLSGHAGIDWYGFRFISTLAGPPSSQLGTHYTGYPQRSWSLPLAPPIWPGYLAPLFNRGPGDDPVMLHDRYYGPEFVPIDMAFPPTLTLASCQQQQSYERTTPTVRT